VAAEHLRVVEGLNGLLSLWDIRVEDHSALGASLRLFLKSDRGDLSDAFKLFFDLIFSDLKGNEVDEDIVVECFLHVLGNGGKALLVQLIFLLVNEAGNEDHATIDLGVVHFVQGTDGILRLDKAHETRTGALALFVLFELAWIEFSKFAEQNLDGLLIEARVESLNVEVGEVLGVSGGSLVSLFVDVDFEGVTFPNLSVESQNWPLGIFHVCVLDVGEATGRAIFEDA
jgi:hypothetical protein